MTRFLSNHSIILVFKEYLRRGKIRIIEDGWFHDISIDDIIFEEGFYI